MSNGFRSMVKRILAAHGLRLTREPVAASFRCCGNIGMASLNINGRVDTGKPILALCCEPLPDIPKVGFQETAEDTLRVFMGECASVWAECVSSPEDSQRYFTAGCAECAHFREGDYHTDGLIHYVNLSMYPAPCQSRCFYCSVHKEDQSVDSDAVRAEYEKLFDMLELADHCGIVDPKATWQVSSGEITIHPYRDRIMELVRGKSAVFYTNCMKFDEDIAQNLHDNPSSAINLSIDAGTPETWKKVKGVDNFDKVKENLMKYSERSARPEQITLKYIIFPGVNDTHEDYESLVELMGALKVRHLTLSRDLGRQYHAGQQERAELVDTTARLMSICRENGITNSMAPTFTPEEWGKAIQLSEKIR